MTSIRKISSALVGLVALLCAAGLQAATTNQSAGAPVVVLPIHISGQYTATTAAVAKYKMPFACKLIGVSATARASGGSSPTLTVNLLEAGTTVLSSAVSITAGTVSEATIADDAIADEAELSVTLTIGGSSPTWNDISILVTCVRH